jgi:hypothetical protein
MNGPALRVPTGSGAPTRFFSRIPVKASRLRRPHISSYLVNPDRQPSQAAGRHRPRLTDPKTRPTISRESTPPQTDRRPKPKRLGRRFIVRRVCTASRSAQPLPRRPSPARGQQAVAPCGQQAIASLWPTDHRQPVANRPSPASRSARAVAANPGLPHLPRRAQDPARRAQPDPAEAKEKNVPLIGRPRDIHPRALELQHSALEDLQRHCGSEPASGHFRSTPPGAPGEGARSARRIGLYDFVHGPSSIANTSLA